MAVSSIFSLLSFSPSHPPSLRASLSPYHSSPVYNTAKDGWAQPVKTSVHQRCTSPLHSSPSDNFDLAPAVFPSLTHPNTPYSSAYNAEVIVEENEPEERLINRFRREVMKTGLIYECRRRRFFENKQEEKKRKSREAAKRNSRRRRSFFDDKREDFTNKNERARVKEEEEDNWELPEGDLVY
ncbi:unnamed protein product [Cuscuta epithymum]|uniref:Ribosomal protein S21 n=1 Tax=Cuscuta epithymum TaxID=186058 RepID=A0AAV0E3G8_9ASTE|nr:unnamed protein product [Cuscuta epithymum]CAH9146289.1 unnamed protein product [Cuscuta epithymum]